MGPMPRVLLIPNAVKHAAMAALPEFRAWLAARAAIVAEMDSAEVLTQADRLPEADQASRAIVRAATEATGLPNLPAARDLKR